MKPHKTPPTHQRQPGRFGPSFAGRRGGFECRPTGRRPEWCGVLGTGSHARRSETRATLRRDGQSGLAVQRQPGPGER